MFFYVFYSHIHVFYNYGLGRRADIVDAALSRSALWQKCVVLQLYRNMRVERCSRDEQHSAQLRQYADWLSSRAILCPRNHTVDDMNDRVLVMFPGDTVTCFSVDSVAEFDQQAEFVDSQWTAAAQAQYQSRGTCNVAAKH